MSKIIKSLPDGPVNLFNGREMRIDPQLQLGSDSSLEAALGSNSIEGIYVGHNEAWPKTFPEKGLTLAASSYKFILAGGGGGGGANWASGGSGGYGDVNVNLSSFSGSNLKIVIGSGGSLDLDSASAYGNPGVVLSPTTGNTNAGGGYTGLFTAANVPIFMVGGGGGAAYYDQGGNGGGLGTNGGRGWDNRGDSTTEGSPTVVPIGGTQIAGGYYSGADAESCTGEPGSYLQGGNGCPTASYPGGGGGGGYYGGGAGTGNTGGGGTPGSGGSGYIDTSLSYTINATNTQNDRLSVIQNDPYPANIKYYQPGLPPELGAGYGAGTYSDSGRDGGAGLFKIIDIATGAEILSLISPGAHLIQVQ